MWRGKSKEGWKEGALDSRRKGRSWGTVGGRRESERGGDEK